MGTKVIVGVLIRDIPNYECPWLDGGLKRGTAVFAYLGPTYGLVGPDQVAVILEPSEPFPFLALPKNSVLWD